MHVFQCRAALLVLVTLLLASTEGLEIGFGEVDYRAEEGDGTIQVQISKFGRNEGDVVVGVTTYTYGEFEANGFAFPEAFESPDQRPDPAEYNPLPGGRTDFFSSQQNVTFIGPDSSTQDIILNIDIINDDIDEATEGFLAVLEVFEESLNSSDAAFTIDINVTLCRIMDDDPIELGFERTMYTFFETAGNVSDEIQFGKIAGRETEQELSVLLQFSEMTANEGSDFILGSPVPIRFDFPPSSQMMAVPLEIIDDITPERRNEVFNLFLTRPGDSPLYGLNNPVAQVAIVDDDVVVVGFEQTQYTVEENEGRVEVCVRVFEPDRIDASINVLLFTVRGSARETVDFVPVFNFLLTFDQDLRRECLNITIVDDNIRENNETFNAILVGEIITPSLFIRLNATMITITDGVDFVIGTPLPTMTVSCDDDDCSVAIGITFLCTFLITALIAVLVCVLCICLDRHRKKDTKENAYQVQQEEYIHVQAVVTAT